MKAALKIIALIKAFNLCYGPLLGMPGQESSIDIDFPVLPPMPPVLPLLVTQSQPDSTLDELLERVYQEWWQKHVATEQTQELQEEKIEQKEDEESLERSLKRRRIEKEEDTDDFLQLTQVQPLPSTTTTTTTVNSLTGMTTRPLGRASAPVWEEQEWESILRAVDQRTAREDAEEFFQGLLPQIEDTLFRRNSNLINLIGERFFEREITLDELNADIARSPYTVRLSVRASYSQDITPLQIQLIGERFPNLRELDLSDFDLQDPELAMLAQQPFASRLIALNIIGTSITVRVIERYMAVFSKLRSLSVSGGSKKFLSALARLPFASQLTHLRINDVKTNPNEIEASMGMFSSLTRLAFTSSRISNQGLLALARQPFARNLTYLDIENNLIDEIGVAGMGTFVSLAHLTISRNEIGDSGLERLAQQPFAPRLITLELSHCENSNTQESITEQGLSSMGVFTNLRVLDISENGIGDEGFAVIARQPFASQLTNLDVSDNGLTTEGVEATIGSFIRLTRLRISSNSIGDAGLAFLAQQPFASAIVLLDIEWNGITLEGIRTSMGAFTSLRTLDISGNNIDDVGLEQLAQQPFASRLIKLFMNNKSLTARGLRASLRAFANLEYLYLASNSVGEEGFEVLAELPFAQRLTLTLYEKAGNRTSREQCKKYAGKFKVLKLNRDWTLY